MGYGYYGYGYNGYSYGVYSSGYGYGSYSYSNYGYSSYGYGLYEHGVHGTRPAGGFYDVRQYLNGPGTTAYLHSGIYTDYAREGANGSIYQHNTTAYENGNVKSSTYYGFHSGYYSYSHYSTSEIFSPTAYSYHGYYGSYYYAGPSRTREYSATDIESYYSAGNSARYTQRLFETDFSNGSYYGSYASTSAVSEPGSPFLGPVSTYSTTFSG